MMLLDMILNSNDFKMLKKESEKGFLSQALLLQTKDDLYADEFAKAIAMLIMDEGKCCMSCENCAKIIANAHPDVKSYPSKDKLLVSDSEEIVEECFVKPIFANRKVFIIKNIDNSTESAQNKLLKTLEEPNKNVYIIMTCSNIEMVMPTIKSRCSKIQLEKLNKNQIASVVNNNLALSLCDGLVGKAVILSKNNYLEEICQNVISILCDMKHSSQVLSFGKKILEKKENLLLTLEIMTFLIEDLIKIKSGQEALVKLPFKERLEEIKNEYSVRALCEIVFLIEKISKERFYNVNVNLFFENFLMNILEVKYLCK